jgi:hypothetical protein
MLSSDAAFNKYLKYVETEIGSKALIGQHQEGRVGAIEGKDVPAVNKERQEAQADLTKVGEAMEKLKTLHQDVWLRAPAQAIVGF